MLSLSDDNQAGDIEAVKSTADSYMTFLISIILIFEQMVSQI